MESESFHFRFDRRKKELKSMNGDGLLVSLNEITSKAVGKTESWQQMTDKVFKL